ncbi:MAG: FHA domain-containing protein [Pirellulales bacterium]|nr:FHA domain-containing protein [Pirellulales bacterium]
MQVKLVVIAGASKSGEITVKPPMTLGRSRDADLTLRHALISRKHCEIAESNGQIIVRDLGSLNGTFIGGQRINEAPLNNGDELMVGSVTFRVQLGEGAAVGGPTEQGPIPQGVDPATGLQFLEPVDAVETVPVEQSAVADAVSPDASAVGTLETADEETIQPQQPTAQQPAAVSPDGDPVFVPEPAAPAPADDEVAFEVPGDVTSEPETDDSALGSFLKKL